MGKSSTCENKTLFLSCFGFFRFKNYFFFGVEEWQFSKQQYSKAGSSNLTKKKIKKKGNKFVFKNNNYKRNKLLIKEQEYLAILQAHTMCKRLVPRILEQESKTKYLNMFRGRIGQEKNDFEHCGNSHVLVNNSIPSIHLTKFMNIIMKLSK